MTGSVPAIEALGVSKRFGPVVALADVSIRADYGRVTCLLGDNGAGKSTLIKVLGGVHRPDSGTLRLDGERFELRSPRDALDRDVALVFQDLAMVPILGVARNFFVGREPTKGRGPFRRLDVAQMAERARAELGRIGIDIEDTSRFVATLSGGERQAVAIARAVYFGARVLILDEPTSALGVKQASVVLRYIAQARMKGVAIIFITHNVHHAHLIGDTFTVLNHGRSLGTFAKEEVTVAELERMMAGGSELESLRAELTEILESPSKA